jgi:thiol-disulfide isomerase/thioredoxin
MKDFKGKVVLIDVWATWCGPCKAEFPYLKEIEEEYRDNENMVFVGISTDKIEKKDSWLSLIRKEKLAGVQLLDDIGKGFARKYGIASIPRFLLINKQGRWKEIRCPRPSDAKNLKRYLNEELGR